MKKKKHYPKIAIVVLESNLSDDIKRTAISNIMRISKSDARRSYSKFKDDVSELYLAFDWRKTYPGYEYWSNLNLLLIQNNSNY